MGAAAIATALWKYSMRYNPANPDWINRDRESCFRLGREVWRWVIDHSGIYRIRALCWSRVPASIHHASSFWIFFLDP